MKSFKITISDPVLFREESYFVFAETEEKARLALKEIKPYSVVKSIEVDSSKASEEQ